ncbi:MAG: hypothetical protein WBK51_12410 [Polaromonas sp.]
MPSAVSQSPKNASSAPAGSQSNLPGESDWRVLGHYTFNSNQYVTISRGQSIRTLINPKGFYFDALRATGTLDGNLLTNYTGQTESSSLISEPKK